MKFNELILMYDYYCRLADHYFFGEEWNWLEMYCQCEIIADHIERMIEAMVEEGV